MRLPLFIAIAGLAGCATLNISPECRDTYNACLNACQAQGAPMSAAYGVTNGSTPGPNTPTLPAGTGNEMTQAGCASDCRRNADACSVRARAAKPDQGNSY
jgi:hypothetical protein